MCGLVCRVPHVNIRMSLVIGSVPTPLTWHGAWLRLIEDTTTARGALASALATRTPRPAFLPGLWKWFGSFQCTPCTRSHNTRRSCTWTQQECGPQCTARNQALGAPRGAYQSWRQSQGRFPQQQCGTHPPLLLPLGSTWARSKEGGRSPLAGLPLRQGGRRHRSSWEAPTRGCPSTVHLLFIADQR